MQNSKAIGKRVASLKRQDKPKDNKNRQKRQKKEPKVVGPDQRNIIRAKPEWYSNDLNKAMSTVGASNKKVVKDLVEGMIALDRHYTMPRPVSAPVYSNRYNFVKTISISSAEAANPDLCEVALITRPRVDRVLSVGRSTTSKTLETGSQVVRTPKTRYLSTSQNYSLRWIPVMTDGSDIIPTPDYSLTNFVISQPNDSSPLSGAFVLPISTSGASPATWYLQILNNEPNSIQLVVTLYAYSGQPGSLSLLSSLAVTTSVISSGASSSANFATAVGFAAFWTTLTSATNLVVGITQAAPATDEYELSNLSFEMYTSACTFDSGFAWTHYSLWDLLPNNAESKSVFDKSDSYSVTGMNVIFTNNTPALSKGGVAYAARLPGGSEDKLGQTFDAIENTLRTIKDNNFKSTELDKGLFWYYTPEKVTDYFFLPIDDPGRRPYAVCALTCPSGISGNFVLTIQGCVNIELMTYNPVCALTRSVPNDQLFSAICASLSTLNGWSHNPDHFSHIKKAISSVMTEDNIKTVLKGLVSAGVKLAPMVIAALA